MTGLLRRSLLGLSTLACLFGDVTYDQNVRYTGGTMLNIVRKMASNPTPRSSGAGDLQAEFQDQKFTVYLKGPKMARVGNSLSLLYDIDAGTITTINNRQHTYSVMTFEEMRQHGEHIQQRVDRSGTANADFDVKLDRTGHTRNINGQAAHEALMTLTAKSGGANGQMVVKADAWLVPLELATREVMDYSNRLSAKFGETFSGSPMLGAASAGIGTAMKEAAKLDGYSVLTDIDVSGVSSPMLSAMGSANNDANTPLIQMEIESSKFIAGPVDDSRFTIPPGYTEQSHHP
ncbi:MAG: hypothetical protein ACR2JB_19185 [Bryobacteraceae bacterium]